MLEKRREGGEWPVSNKLSLEYFIEFTVGPWPTGMRNWRADSLLRKLFLWE